MNKKKTYSNNLVKVHHTLVVFNLGNNLDVLALFAEDTADLVQGGSVSNEGREDHVHLFYLSQLNRDPAMAYQDTKPMI